MLRSATLPAPLPTRVSPSAVMLRTRPGRQMLKTRLMAVNERGKERRKGQGRGRRRGNFAPLIDASPKEEKRGIPLHFSLSFVPLNQVIQSSVRLLHIFRLSFFPFPSSIVLPLRNANVCFAPLPQSYLAIQRDSSSLFRIFRRGVQSIFFPFMPRVTTCSLLFSLIFHP